VRAELNTAAPWPIATHGCFWCVLSSRQADVSASCWYWMGHTLADGNNLHQHHGVLTPYKHCNTALAVYCTATLACSTSAPQRNLTLHKLRSLFVYNCTATRVGLRPQFEHEVHRDQTPDSGWWPIRRLSTGFKNAASLHAGAHVSGVLSSLIVLRLSFFGSVFRSCIAHVADGPTCIAVAGDWTLHCHAFLSASIQ